MIRTEEIETMLQNGDGTVVGEDGDKLGKVSQVFLDDQTGRPEWATVAAGGLFGGRESFVPLAEASLNGSQITIPWSKAKVKDAPEVNVGSDGHISEDQEATLYQYYGMTYSTAAPDTRRPAQAGQVGHDTSGPNTDEAMTRSEERLVAGTQTTETGRARLRKYVAETQ